MKKTQLILVFILTFICSPIGSIAQSFVDVSHGEPYELENGARYQRYYKVGNHIISLRQHGDDEFYLTKYSIEKLALENEVFHDLEKHEYQFGAYQNQNDEIFIIYGLFEKKSATFYARKVNPEDLSLGKKISLFSASDIAKNHIAIPDFDASLDELMYGALGAGQGYPALLITSPDRSKMAIHYFTGSKRKEPSTAHWIIFDNNLQKIGAIKNNSEENTELTITYVENNLTNDGAIICLKSEMKKLSYADKVAIAYGGKEPPQPKFYILYQNPNTQEVAQNEVESPYPAITNMQIIYDDKNGEFYLMGSYNLNTNEDADDEATFGFCMANITKGNIGEFISYEIPKEVRQKYLTEEEINERLKKNGTALKNVVINSVNFDTDGSFIISAQNCFIESEMRGSERVAYYYTGMIIIMKINPDRTEIAWADKIPSFQKAKPIRKFMAGFIYLSNDQFSYIIFQDKDNFNFKAGDDPKFHYVRFPSNIIAYKIEKEDGSMTKEKVLDMKTYMGEGVEKFMKKHLIVLNNTNFIIEMGHDHNNVLVRMDFK